MKRPERVSGAIYDVDDTLLDNEQAAHGLAGNLHGVANVAAIKKLAALPEGAYQHLSDITYEEVVRNFEASPIHTVPGTFYTLLKSRGILSGDIDPTHPLIEQLLLLKNAAYAELLAQYGCAVPGAIEFVRDFSTHFGIEHKNAIASTATFPDIKAFLGISALTPYFPDERIIDCSRVTHPKPHPEIFDTAFRTLGLPDSERQNVVAFEDHPRGMLSARKTGLYVCALVTEAYSRRMLEQAEAQPDFIADSYDDFREYFGLDQLA